MTYSRASIDTPHHNASQGTIPALAVIGLHVTATSASPIARNQSIEVESITSMLCSKEA
jgi:hypothetical protein